MDDAGIGRHHLEAGKCFLRPAQQRVTLAVALELEIGVHLKRRRRSELVDDDRVIDDELGGQHRIHLLRVAAHFHHRIPHRGEIDDRRYAGEVLQQDARRHERDLFVRKLQRLPSGELLDIGAADGVAVFPPQQVLEQDLERVGQAADREAASFESIQPVDLVGFPAGLQRRAAAETIGAHCGRTLTATTKYSVSPKQLVGMPLCC